MKKIILLLILFLSATHGFCETRQDLLTFESIHSVEVTRTRLIQILENKGFTIFKNINHAQGAKKVGIELRDTSVTIFGNPKIGSKLMQCSPTLAIDLPQKALIWKDSENKVWLAVNNPEYLKQRHKVQGCDAFFTKVKTALNAIANKATK